MTAVFSSSNFNSFSSDNVLSIFTIEVITFDGESHIFEIEAADGDEAVPLRVNFVQTSIGVYCKVYKSLLTPSISVS